MVTHPPLPDPPPADIAGIPWRQIEQRTHLGAGGPGDQLVHVVLSLWPYIQVAGAGALAGASAKAGADAWDLGKRGLQSALHRLLGHTADRVTIEVVSERDEDPGITYEFEAEDMDNIDE